MKAETRIFTWYAAHPRDGDLVLAVTAVDDFKYCYIYAPKIITERLKPRMNALIALELSLGPMGTIPKKYYLEAGFTAKLPFRIRMIALIETSKPTPAEGWVSQYDELISKFMLEEWQKNVIDVR